MTYRTVVRVLLSCCLLWLAWYHVHWSAWTILALMMLGHEAIALVLADIRKRLEIMEAPKP